MKSMNIKLHDMCDKIFQGNSLFPLGTLCTPSAAVFIAAQGKITTDKEFFSPTLGKIKKTTFIFSCGGNKYTLIVRLAYSTGCPTNLFSLFILQFLISFCRN